MYCFEGFETAKEMPGQAGHDEISRQARNDEPLSYLLELIAQPVQLNGGADAVHYFCGGEEEPIGLGGAGFGRLAHQEIVSLEGAGLHGGTALLGFMQDGFCDMVVHVVEAALAKEVTIRHGLISLPVPVPKGGDGHTEVAGAAEAEFGPGVEVADGVAVEGGGVAEPGFVKVGGLQERAAEPAGGGANP